MRTHACMIQSTHVYDIDTAAMSLMIMHGGAMSTVMRVMMLMMVMVRARVMAMLATVVTAIQ